MDAYIYRAALYCSGCGEDIREKRQLACAAPEDPDDESTYDSDDYPKGPYWDGGGEADTPQRCDSCGVFLENPLTTDGYAYVQEAIAFGHDLRSLDGVLHIVWRNPIVKEWAEFYDMPIAPKDENDV